MPQAVAAISAWYAANAAVWYVALARVILINVALGAIEFTDEDGTEWRAVG